MEHLSRAFLEHTFQLPFMGASGCQLWTVTLLRECQTGRILLQSPNPHQRGILWPCID